MWERFSYYGMRALLVMYMYSYLLADPARAAQVLGYSTLEGWLIGVFGPLTVKQMSSQLYGLYTGFVYFTPFFGGMIADRILGQRKSVYIGGVLMAIGHFLMASEQLFLWALLFLILGNGFFKPNISTQVAGLYADGDPRRDRAYTIFYMGINLGAIFSPLVCGTLGQMVGWHWGFGAAGVGMVLGLITYALGNKLIPGDVIKHKDGHVAEKRPMTREEWGSVASLAVLCMLTVLFWAIYEQQGNTLQIWADERTNWTFFGVTVPSTWFQLMNPVLIIILAPLLNIVWAKQAARGKEPGSVSKMAIGCFLCGAAYIFMILAAGAVPAGERGSLLWLFGCVFLFTVGELYLSPIGLSLVTKVAPKPVVSMMMGVWFLATFFGNYLAGYLGTFYESFANQSSFFVLLFVLGVLSAAGFLAFKKPLERTIGKGV
ncbi:peptide MFS transporter [bacterium]|nr:peptide MFS transporter [bacterium]